MPYPLSSQTPLIAGLFGPWPGRHRADDIARRELTEHISVLHRELHGVGSVAQCGRCTAMSDPSWRRLSPVRRTVRGTHRRR